MKETILPAPAGTNLYRIWYAEELKGVPATNPIMDVLPVIAWRLIEREDDEPGVRKYAEPIVPFEQPYLWASNEIFVINTPDGKFREIQFLGDVFDTLRDCVQELISRIEENLANPDVDGQ